MKNKSQLEKSDKWIVGLTALCALLLFSWLVYDMAFLNPLLKGQVEIGEIYEATNRVKRKFNRSLIWYEAGANEIVYENDWIFTGAASIAKIRLKGGGEIVIEPDSLIILSRKNGVLQLDLQHGRLLADVKSEDIKINVVREDGVETVDTSQGVVAVSQEVDEAADALVDDIDLDLDNDGSDDLTLSDVADQRAYEPEAGYSKINKSALSLSLKEFFEFELYKGQNAQVGLDWKDPFERFTSYEVEVATTPNFEIPIANPITKELATSFKTKEPGLFYWRARGLDAEGEPADWSQAQEVQVIIRFLNKVAPVTLSRKKILYQLDADELSQVRPDRSYKSKEDKTITLQWQGREEDDLNYKVQVSDKEDFSNIIEEKIIPETSIQLENLHLGKTYFKVVPETKDGVPAGEAAVGEVTSHFPAPQSLRTIDKNEYQVARWKPIPYAKAYEVRYKTDKNSDEEVVQYVSSNRLRIDNKTGFLQWNVRVVDPETKESMGVLSETVDWYNAAKRLASLHGSGQAGTLYPQITKPESRKTFISVNGRPLFIVMNWTYAKEAKAYEVEISKKPDMNELVYKKTSEKKRAVINQKFQPGIYFMRVRALTEDVTQESWSEVEVFRVINQDG